jgi:multicomponent K+:H+ antiporter subunit D
VNHWIILPLLLPALVAPLIALAVRHDIVLQRVFSVASTVILLVIGAILMASTAAEPVQSYHLGNWIAPFGIVLVLDRLSALLLVLTAGLGLAVLLYAINGWDAEGRHFHPLFQFQLMGINGAFLTGDIFNLFVFFEVLLIASYGLMVHAGGAARMKAGVQYVTINLVGSGLFLIGVGLIYSVTGTLNMAHLATEVARVDAADRALLEIGGLLLLLVFAVKAALVPVQFWLPGTYANAPPPVAALFAIMTKVGAYAIIRVYTLIFGDDAGASANLAGPWLLPAALVTMVIGMAGVLAARRLGEAVAFAVIGSMGTLLAAVAVFTEEAMSAALYYLLHSTVAAGALFLIVDLVNQRRTGYGDLLRAAPPFAHTGFIAGLFLLGAMAMTGLPPLSGFIGKLLVLDGVRESAYAAWIWTLVLVTSLLAIVGFARAGTTVFWKSAAIDGYLEPDRPLTPALPFVAVGILLGASVLLTAFAGPVTLYLDTVAEQIYNPAEYIETVLPASGHPEGVRP